MTYNFKDERKECKFCKTKCEERLQNDIEYDSMSNCYGDFEHICPNCGAIGKEIFGHGIQWIKSK